MVITKCLDYRLHTLNLPDSFPVIKTISSNSRRFACLCGNNESVTEEYTVESDNICYTVQPKKIL